uniref:ATPase AAA-type core domain-containing protein n=2 Tax=Lygodium japonicum TaxID=13824 RepID=S4UES8_LYGJA|nr:conserved hypothetical protein Ycf2 [Lygodium japonicum]YP_008474536.1 conserved hypothetical protein Ycf2 [Lygodium japonicum]AGI51454.1 conserved hypothetical protein Ycf2 [Lygodium japonicum]AGI51461.1 conserved hypothetical protein Ycf2 [Lygodium japonicum]
MIERRNEVEKVEENKVRTFYSLSNLLESVGIDRFHYFFEVFKNQNQGESLMGPFSSYKPFIKLFDLRMLGSRFLRDPRGSVRERGNSTALEILVLLAVAILVHRLNERDSIQRGSIDLARLLHRGTAVKEPAIDFSQFSYSVPPSVGFSKGGKKGVYQNNDSRLNGDFFAGSGGEKQEFPTYEVRNPPVSGGCKVWAVRNPSGNTSGKMMNRIHLRSMDSNPGDFRRFFEFYRFLVRRKNDCYQKDSDRLRVTKQKRNLLPFKKLDFMLLEYRDSVHRQQVESLFPFAVGLAGNSSNRGLYLFQNPKWFLQSLGFDSHQNRGESSILQIYSKTKNESIDQLIGFLIPFNTIVLKKFELPNSKYLRLEKVLPRVNNGNKNTACPSRFKEEKSIHFLYSLVKWYEQKRLISLCSIYTLLLHDDLRALAYECVSRIHYQLDGGAGSKGSTRLENFFLEERFLKWKKYAGYFLSKRIPFRIDEDMDAWSNAHGWLDTIGNLSLSPSGKVSLGIESDLDTSIREISIWKNRFLTSPIGNTDMAIERNRRYSHELTNMSFLCKSIFSKVFCREVLRDTIDYWLDKLNDMTWLDPFLDSLNIEKKVSVLKGILKEKDRLSMDSGLLMNEEPANYSIFLEHTVDFSLVEFSCIESIQTNFSDHALSITGRQNWNLFLQNWSCGKGSNRSIGNISRHILDRMNTRDFLNQSHLFLLNHAKKDSIPELRIKKDLLIGRYSNSYSNLLDDFPVGSDHEVIYLLRIGSFGREEIISSIQSHVSDWLFPNFLQRAEREIKDSICATIQPTPSDPDKLTVFPIHSDRHFNSLLDLKRFLSKLSPSARETGDSSLFSCSRSGNSSRETSRNSKLSTDRRPRPRPKNMGLDQVDSEKSIEERSSLVNDCIGNRIDQNDSSIRSFWESEELETLYWSKKSSLFRIGATRSFTELIGRGVLHKEKLADLDVWEEPIRLSHPIDFKEFLNDFNEYMISWICWRDNISEKWSLFWEYIPWFFTITWWRYFYDLIQETYPEVRLKVNDDLRYNIPRIGERMANRIDSASSYLLQKLASRFRKRFRNDSINNIFSRIDLFLVKEMNETKVSFSGWSTVKLPNQSILYYLILWILFVLASSKHFWPAVSGFSSLYLWKRFNTIEYLMDPRRRSHLEKVMYSPSIKEMTTRDLLIHSLKRFLNYLNNIFFYSLVKSELESWMLHKESPDTLRTNKELLTQYLVTNETVSEYESKLNSSSSSGMNHESSPQEGLLFLSYLLQIRQNNLWNYKIHKSDPAEKWVSSAFERNLLTMRQSGVPHRPCRETPISLQSGFLLSKGILLVGSEETGRSYLIRDIASNSHFPLVNLPIRKLLYNRSYFKKNVRGFFISKESVRRVNSIFGIAKEMSPCTIWIQDIHELSVHGSYHKLEADPRFLLCLVLRNIHNESRDSRIRNNLVMASTHIPAKIDPALIAPNRLNQLINLRKPNSFQRQKELSILSCVKGFDIQADPSFLKGTGFGTTGYSKRDLFFLAHEALLISTYRREKIVCSNAILFALHRQRVVATYLDNAIESGSEYKIFFHRIGKAILKKSLVDTPTTDSLWIGTNTLKKQFYHLSDWYLESPRTESTIMELTLFPHILGLLAVLAAHDYWLRMDLLKGDNPIIIDKYLENGFHLACGILENLLRDFPRPEIFGSGNQSENSLSFPSPMGCSPDMIHASRFSQSTGKKGLRTNYEIKQSGETDLISEEVSRETTGSPKLWNFSFMRSGTYESIRLSSESDDLQNVILLHQIHSKIYQRELDWNTIKLSQIESYDTKGSFFSYERTLDKLKQRQAKRLEDRFETISLREQFLELGISDSSNPYETQWNRSDEPSLFVGGRFVWDPTLLFQSDPNPPSSRRSFLVKQEFLRRLYVTYGMRKEREKRFPNEKIKKSFLNRGYDRKSITTESLKKQSNNGHSDEGQHSDSEYLKETWFMHIHLQYPHISRPIHLYQNIVVEDWKDRFIRPRLLVHRNRWMRRNRSQFKDFLIYNMLLESYQYLLNPFWFDGTSLDRTAKEFSNESSV